MHGGCRVATEVKSRRASATRKVPETTRGNAPTEAPAQAPAKKTARKPATTKTVAKKTAAKTRRPAPEPVREPLEIIIEAMDAVRAGDFSVRLPLNWQGHEGQLAQILNGIVSQNRRLAAELSRVHQAVGREGQTRQRIVPADRQGQWAGMEESVNALIDDLVRPVEAMSEAMAGVAKGDLTRSVPLEADGRPLKGEFLRSANIVNRMIDADGRVQLRGHARGAARSAPTAAWAARPRCKGVVGRLEGPDRHRSTRWRPTSPRRCATSPT